MARRYDQADLGRPLGRLVTLTPGDYGLALAATQFVELDDGRRTTVQFPCAMTIHDPHSCKARELRQDRRELLLVEEVDEPDADEWDDKWDQILQALRKAGVRADAASAAAS